MEPTTEEIELAEDQILLFGCTYEVVGIGNTEVGLANAVPASGHK